MTAGRRNPAANICSPNIGNFLGIRLTRTRPRKIRRIKNDGKRTGEEGGEREKEKESDTFRKQRNVKRETIATETARSYDRNVTLFIKNEKDFDIFH